MTADTDDDITIASRMFVHCADLAGSCKAEKIANRWSRLVNEEFMAQVAAADAVRRREEAEPAAE